MRYVIALLLALASEAGAQTLVANGGPPGGSNTQCQYNSNGVFGGITGCTTNGTAVTLVAPVLGTPASGVATNLTGTASGLTAGNVTGTGVGSATSLALGGATIGSNALAVTGTSLFSSTLTGPQHIGGTAAGSTLTLTSTSGTGTTDAIILNVGTNGGTEALRAVTGGQLIKGSTAAQTFVIVPAVQVLGTTAGNAAMAGFGYANDATTGGTIILGKSRSATPGSFVTVSGTDTIGTLSFRADDGTSVITGARINAAVDGTVATGKMPLRISFANALAATGTVTQTMSIFNDGGVIFGVNTASPGPGVVQVQASTASTSKTTGSIINAGGFGNAGAIFTDTLNVITMANAATTSAACYNTATGLLTYNSTIGTCTVSVLAAKNLIAPLSAEEGYRIVMALKPWTYTLKEGLPTYMPGEQIGFVADYALRDEPRLVAVGANRKVEGFRYEQYTAALTAAFHKLATDVADLKLKKHD